MEKGRTLSEKTFLSWYRWVLLVSISIIAATDITATIVASSIPEYRYTIGTITNYLVGGYGLLVVFTSVAALIRGSKFWNMTNGDNEKAARRQRTVRLISIYLSALLPLISLSFLKCRSIVCSFCNCFWFHIYRLGRQQRFLHERRHFVLPLATLQYRSFFLSPSFSIHH